MREKPPLNCMKSLCLDYEKILEAYPLKDYDVDYMISLYGTEYEKFMQDCVNGKYSEQKRI